MFIMSIHTFGDSHSHLGFESININNVSIMTHWIGPVLCYTFGNKKLDVLDISKYGVNDGDTVIFCFGEIDCRAHVYRFVNETTTYQEVIDKLIVNYFEAISENINKYTNLNTLVYNVVPPANVHSRHTMEECMEHIFTKNKTEIPWKGTNEERKQYHLYFNQKLKEFCLSYNYTFLDVYEKYCDNDGFINDDLSDKNVHIKNPTFIEQFLISYQNTIINEPVKSPNKKYLTDVYYNSIPEHITHIKIDIGMGMWNIHSLDWLSKDKNMFLLCFEPNIDSRNSCMNYINNVNNIIFDNRNAVAIVPVALSNVDIPTEMNFYSMFEDGGTSSLYEPVDPRLGPVKSRIPVPVYSLKHFFDVFPWDRFEYIEYIKIDAQGADFDIIKGAGSYLKDRVVFITAEPENEQYSGCNHNTADNMTEYLRNQGFIRIAHPNTSDPTFLNTKYTHLYDKIYIRQIS